MRASNASDDRLKYQWLSATAAHKLAIKPWFTNASQLTSWGGPNMVFPISDADFVSALSHEHLGSFCLVDEQQQVLAFGQHYVRLGRHHLGRLAVNPHFRGLGLAKELIERLLLQAKQDREARGASLFVYPDNRVAFNCYRSLGFREQAYPADLPEGMPECVYMVRDEA